jgi:hypothetical protein
MATLYRFRTGDDDSAFCHKVSAALAEGWSLHGGPAYAFDSARGVMRCGQAVTKSVERAYDPEMRLRDA